MLDIYTIDPHNSLSLSRTECIDQLQVSKPIGRILEQQGDRSLAHTQLRPNTREEQKTTRTRKGKKKRHKRYYIFM